jgi:hypothetical protein
MTGVRPAGADGALAFAGETLHGTRIDATLDTAGVDGPNAERWTVRLVLADDAATVEHTEHRQRWRDWLHWGNVLQFLDGDGCQTLITTTGVEGELEVDLHTAPAPTAEADHHDGALAAALEEDIQLADPAVQALLRTLAAQPGGRGFVVGEETDDGGLLEVAWPDARVAILVDGQVPPAGWTARRAQEWDAPALLDALRNGGS